MSSMTEPRL